MLDTSSVMYGELNPWPSKLALAKILKAGGFSIYVGRFSVRINDFDHFQFDEYGGDLGEPQISADADSSQEMIDNSKRVSWVLSQAQIKHRFEVYDHHDQLVCYLHYDWPLQ